MSSFRPSTPRRLRIFTALDLDRTILNSTKFFEDYVLPAIRAYYCSTVKASEQATDSLLAEVSAREKRNRGKAFDILAVLNEIAASQKLGPLDLAALAQLLLSANSDNTVPCDRFVQDIIADGGIELIQALEAEPDSAWAFYTTGGVQTQTLKLSVLRSILQKKYHIHDIRWQIIATENKANDIADTWYDVTAECFRIPYDLVDEELMAMRVRVIDDKLDNVQVKPAKAGCANIQSHLVQRAETPIGTGELLHAIAETIKHE